MGLVVLGCRESAPETSRRQPLVLTAEAQERLIPDLDIKVLSINEKGFRFNVAVGFGQDGEEKLKSAEVQASWPVVLPPRSTWTRIPDPMQERYRAGDLEFGFTWVSAPRFSSDCTVVNLLITRQKGTPLTEIKSLEKSAFHWPSRSVIEIDGKVQTKFVGNVVLPPWQSYAKEDPPEIKSNVKVPVVMIDGPERDHEFVRSAVTNLSYATQRPHLPVAKYGFAPFGLNNSLYFGHTFWDMDVWVLPSMLFLQPEAVRGMNKYRTDRLGTAQWNVYQSGLLDPPNAKEGPEWLSGKEPAALRLGEVSKGMPMAALMFPWESSVTGKETVRGPSQQEHHISGSVLWGLNLSEKAGLLGSQMADAVEFGVGNFYRVRSVEGPNGREIKDVMSPDENHIGDNDLYTNLLAQWAMNGRKWDGATKFKLPKDEKSFLTYDGDKERGYKQAAAVLSIFPLQYPESEKQARTMMERFESKVSKNGPAMSDAIHATIWARLGEKEKAYDAWKRAWEPFVKGPQMMFSEKRSSERTYFYTGAAGCLNTVLYGFAGFRFDENPLEGAVWKKQLKSGWWLSCKPCLPPKWKSLSISPMVIDGEKFSVQITPEKVDIQPVGGS